MIDTENPDFKNLPSSDARPRFPYRLADTPLQPVVSVITPYYNTDEVFAETARSLFDQSFQEWEWVIVNDGSTDTQSLERLAAV
jgi:cellulose synthase/poly-beta-1,6-N-acetylglucosamine synthase-like glycosyltransferase